MTVQMRKRIAELIGVVSLIRLNQSLHKSGVAIVTGGGQ
jgi:hypothetical protein